MQYLCCTTLLESIVHKEVFVSLCLSLSLSLSLSVSPYMVVMCGGRYSIDTINFPGLAPRFSVPGLFPRPPAGPAWGPGASAQGHRCPGASAQSGRPGASAQSGRRGPPYGVCPRVGASPMASVLGGAGLARGGAGVLKPWCFKLYSDYYGGSGA